MSSSGCKRSLGRWRGWLQMRTRTALRASRRYHGNPRLAHQRLPGLSHGHFRDWLALFREVAEKVLEPVHAVDVLRKAEKMGFHLARAAVPGPMPEA